jgi:hypothetical protein
MIKFQQLTSKYDYCFISYNSLTNIHKDWSISRQKESVVMGPHLFEDYQMDSVQFQCESNIEEN